MVIIIAVAFPRDAKPHHGIQGFFTAGTLRSFSIFEYPAMEESMSAWTNFLAERPTVECSAHCVFCFAELLRPKKSATSAKAGNVANSHTARAAPRDARHVGPAFGSPKTCRPQFSAGAG